MGLRLKLGLLTATVILASVLAAGGHYAALAWQLALERIREKGVALVVNLASNSAEGVYSDNLFWQLDPLLESVRLDPDVRRAVVEDLEGRILASTDPGAVGRHMRPPVAWLRFASAQGNVRVSRAGDGTFEMVAPILSPASGIEGRHDRRVIGAVWLELSFARLRQELWRRIAVSGGVTFVLLLLGIAVGAFFSHRLTRPLRRIVEADDAAVRGDHGRAVISEDEVPPDEVGQIMRSRARMMAALRQSEAMHREVAETERRRAAQLERAYDELKRLKELLTQAEKLSVLGRVLAGVAHELNNPLTGIMGYAQLLLLEAGVRRDARLTESLEKISQQSMRCQKIVKNLSAFGRQHKPEKTEVQLNDLLEDCLRLEENQLRIRNVQVERRLAPDLPRAMADYHQLQQVFLNLFSNAQQAMTAARGCGTLTVRTQQVEDRIRVEVEDDGPGIPAEVKPRIFEPFFTTKDVGQGTGLGLSLSYGFVQEHGGEIWVEDVPGGGARFVVELPAWSGQSADAADPATAAVALPTGTTVLVIEDEPVVSEVLVEVLRQLGQEPVVAADGAAARRALLLGDCDAVLCDIHIPGADGLTLFRWVEENRPDLVPHWVFMTGSIGSETMGLLQGTGRPVLNKPFDLDEVGRILEPVLDRAA